MDGNNSPDIDFPAVNILDRLAKRRPDRDRDARSPRRSRPPCARSTASTRSSRPREGSSNTFVQFQIGISSDQAVNDVKNAVDQIRSDLPDGILEPRVSKEEIAGGPIGFFAVSADDMTMEQLSWFIDDTIARRLLSISGMAVVSRAGGVDREIRVGA